MTIQNENNSSELIDIQAASAKNAAAIADALKTDPSMSSFFGGGGSTGSDREYSAPSASEGVSSRSSTLDPFLASGWGGGKKAEIVKNVAGIMFDSGSNGANSSFFGQGKLGQGKQGSGFNITYAGEKGASQPVAQQQRAQYVKLGYWDALKMGPGTSVAANQHFIGSFNLTRASVSGADSNNMHGGKAFTPNCGVTPAVIQSISYTCHTLLQDRNALHQMQNGPLSRNRLIQDAQDGKEGAKQQLRTMSTGQKVEAFRNMSPSIKQDIKDGPGT